MIEALVTVICLASVVPAGLRWGRVAQREHYEPGRVSRISALWGMPIYQLAAVAAVLVAIATSPLVGLAAAAVAGFLPRGLGIKGRSSPLAWTRRMKTLTAVWKGIQVVVLVVAAALGGIHIGAMLLAALAPQIVDVALAIVKPFEEKAAQRFVDDAAAKLAKVDPEIVAITGSYGKTTTKGYVRHLVDGTRSVVASPASFNNRAGLSRAVNEGLHPGTQVFVAEMGTYGPGEISELCSWVKPKVGAICAIGPVHLERYGSAGLDGIVTAKREIVADVETAVLNIDAHGLARVADETEAAGTKVIRCSADVDTERADVVVTPVEDGARLAVEIHGSPVTQIDADGRHPANVAVAVGISLALGVEVPDIVARLDGLPVADHRTQVVTAPSGVKIIDDTFNSNPAGAAAALATLVRHADRNARTAVVTPGMIELGPRQADENERFARDAANSVRDVLLVGRTNLSALRKGAAQGSATVHEVGTRDDAVAWVRSNLKAGDVVLYENDLPDHYP